jgi:hypothetical protein
MTKKIKEVKWLVEPHDVTTQITIEPHISSFWIKNKIKTLTPKNLGLAMFDAPKK